VTSILESSPFPFESADGQKLYKRLYTIHSSIDSALKIAEYAGLRRSKFNLGKSLEDVWHDIISEAAAKGLTRQLVLSAHDELLKGTEPQQYFASLLNATVDTLGRTDQENGADSGTVRSISVKADTLRDVEVLAVARLIQKQADNTPWATIRHANHAFRLKDGLLDMIDDISRDLDAQLNIRAVHREWINRASRSVVGASQRITLDMQIEERQQAVEEVMQDLRRLIDDYFEITQENPP
jgi:Effector-associated domain 1